MLSALPSGTVTLLFTDIEGSTKRWEHLPAAMSSALLTHDLILRSAIEDHGGFVFKTIGDAFCAVFADPVGAAAAAVSAQRSLADETWGEVGHVRVRMALHTGEPEHRDRDYFGPPVNRVARILSTGYGEQVLVSAATAALLRDRLPTDVPLRDLGAHRLKDLLQPERIYQLDIPGLTTAFPPLKTLDRQPHNLPAQPTPLVGREDEVALARSFVETDGVRLVTLTGPGGTGKTRLGLQVAVDLIDAFADGAWFVPLAAITDPDLVVTAIATPLGVRESGHEPLEATLIDYLRDKRLLLVLDNFEQVLGAAPAIGRILAACPDVKMLVTSRAALRVYGERELAVPPLRLPDLAKLPPLAELEKIEAVALFVERALAIKPEWALTAENAGAVAGICVRLEGLPLAIELAAARIRVLSPDKLLDRLSRRLDLLTGGSSDRDSRQQTLRGAIAWSYDLLSHGERQLFRRLSVFAGGCGFDAAEEVCGAGGRLTIDLLDGLESLVQKSLLRQADGPAPRGSPDTRFSMLETIREFGLEQLTEIGEEASLRAAHRAYYLALAETADPELEQGGAQDVWLDRLEAEHDNLRAALQSFQAEERIDDELRLATALRNFWIIRGHLTEGRNLLERMLAQVSDADPKLHARATSTVATISKLHGEYERSRVLFEDALRSYQATGDGRNAAITLANLGLLAIDEGRFDDAEAHVRSGYEAAHAAGDTREVSRCLTFMGIIAFHQGDYDQAAESYGAGLALSRQLRDDYYVATGLVNLAEVQEYRGDPSGAASLYREALPLAEKLGDKFALAFTYLGLGRTEHTQGNHTSAYQYLSSSLSLYQDLGDKVSVAGCLETMAGVFASLGDGVQAARFFGAAELLRETLGAQSSDVYQSEHDANVATARADVGDLFFQVAWHEGRMLTLEQALSEALAARIGVT